MKILSKPKHASSFTYIGAFWIALCTLVRCLTDSEYLRGEFEEIVMSLHL